MPNLAAIRVKANARYTCQECGSTELIQAHHEILGGILFVPTSEILRLQKEKAAAAKL
jgi:hypothetical protein